MLFRTASHLFSWHYETIALESAMAVISIDGCSVTHLLVAGDGAPALCLGIAIGVLGIFEKWTA
jgi:hypothetical protein